MEGQMNIFDFPEYLPEEDFQTMTSKRAAEIVGDRLGIKFKLYERYFANYFKAKKDGFEITIGFSVDVDGNRFLDTEVDHGSSCYGTPAKSIDDCVSSIERYIKKESKQKSKLDIPKAPIWHMSLNHVWEECPNCKIVNKAQDSVRVGYGAEAHDIYVNRERCINCGQLFDWSDEAIEKACKYSKDYPRGDKHETV